MKSNFTGKKIIKAIKNDVIPSCNTNMGNRFYNTLLEIDTGISNITFKDLLAALINNNEIPSLNCYDINEISDRVINKVEFYFMFKIALGY